MKYIVADFEIECPAEMLQVARDLVASAAGDCGFEAFEDSDGGLRGYVQEQMFDSGALDAALADVALPGVEMKYAAAPAEYQNWNSEWENAGFEPIDINGRCVVYDAKHTDRSAVPVKEGCLNVFIDTCQAFGTGTHQTTRMVAGVLLDADLHGKRVLDCGCGTGILGIVASKHGASEVVGYDIDEWSSDNAVHNAQLNGVDNITVHLGDSSVVAGMKNGFDVVVANINRNILLTDMAVFAAVLREGGILALSGFYESDVETVCRAAENEGLHMTGKHVDGDWACVTFVK